MSISQDEYYKISACRGHRVKETSNCKAGKIQSFLTCADEVIAFDYIYGFCYVFWKPSAKQGLYYIVYHF